MWGASPSPMETERSDQSDPERRSTALPPLCLLHLPCFHSWALTVMGGISLVPFSHWERLPLCYLYFPFCFLVHVPLFLSVKLAIKVAWGLGGSFSRVGLTGSLVCVLSGQSCFSELLSVLLWSSLQRRCRFHVSRLLAVRDHCVPVF